MKLQVSQKPVDAQWFLNALSLGRFNATKKELGYDDIHHRFLLATLRDGSVWVVEKNAVVEIRRAKADDLKYPKHEIQLPTHRLTTLKELVNNTIFTDQGKPASEESIRRVSQYDASLSNCQAFIDETIRDNNLKPVDKEGEKMLELQDSAKLFDAFRGLKPVINGITDLAGTLDRTKHGDGLLSELTQEEENKLSSEYKMKAHDRYHSISLKLSDQQLSRLADGESIRLKHSDLSPGEGEGLPVCVTQTQMNRIAKAVAGGKGVQLKFSATQIRVCMDHKVGGGIFTNALRRIGKLAEGAVRGVKKLVGNPIAQQLARGLATSLGNKYGSTAVDAVAGLAGKAIKSNVPDALAPFVDAGMDLGSRLTKQQLESLLKGIKSGSGLYLPGARPSPPPRG
jgi:hypothetical protein